jgi:hypothetical protein
VTQEGHPLITGSVLTLAAAYEAENKVHDIFRAPIRATCHAHPFVLDLITLI